MEEELTLYEEALALKELGFNESTFGYWLSNKTRHIGTESSVAMLAAFSNLTYFKAPTYSQAFKWLRNKYELFGYVYPNDYQKYGYRVVEVKTPENKELIYDWGTKDTPEEAELICLKELIKLIKKDFIKI